MPRTRCALAICLVWFLVGLAHGSYATVLLPATLSDLVVEANAIAHARVVNVRAGWAEGGRRRIDSFVSIEVDRYLKGDLGPRVTIRVPGGELGRYRTIILGAPLLEAGDEVVLFLGARGPSIPYILGLSQGLVRVVMEEGSARKMVRPPLFDVTGNRPVRVVRGDPSRRAISLEEFATRVQQILASRPAEALR